MDNPQSAMSRKQLAENVALREFFFHHNPCRTKNACWNWPKYRDEKGYGCIIYDGFKFAVHRLSFTHYKGKIPKGFVVMHECDNPSCFNPEHLFLGTQGENVEDMMRKGRHSSQRRPQESERKSWAWENPQMPCVAELTPEQIEQRYRFQEYIREQAARKVMA